MVKRNPADRWVVSRQRAHTPLVGEQDFVAVQRLRTRRATDTGETREYLFAGSLRCGPCGLRVISDWSPVDIPPTPEARAGPHTSQPGLSG